MTLTIKINAENPAFDYSHEELRGALDNLIRVAVFDGDKPGRGIIQDPHGNTLGNWELAETVQEKTP